MRSRRLYLITLVLFLVGSGLLSVKHIGSAPEVTCVEEGSTSGWSIEKDGKECPLSVEDARAYWDWGHNSGLPARRTGFGMVVLGLGTGVAGLVAGHKERKRRRQAAAG